MSAQKALGQYFTPAWAASALVTSALPDLSASDVVLDPSCGPGRFLQAIPAHVEALGVEIDAVLAQEARRLTARRVVEGDFCTVSLPARPTVIIGNPPFQLELVDRFLHRAHELLPEQGRCLFILPAYAFQTASRVLRYSEHWGLQQTMIPRNLFPGIKLPLVFASFTKDARRVMVGFALYHETALVQSLPREQAEALVEGPATWSDVVLQGIAALGGEAELRALYDYVSMRRPSANPAWREQVRKVCQKRAVRVSRGVYAARPSVLSGLV